MIIAYSPPLPITRRGNNNENLFFILFIDIKCRIVTFCPLGIAKQKMEAAFFAELSLLSELIPFSTVFIRYLIVLPANYTLTSIFTFLLQRVPSSFAVPDLDGTVKLSYSQNDS